MKIIDIKPRSAKWHQWRSEGIGASESSIILSQSPYKTPWQLWAEKCGFILPESLEGNPHIQRGIQLEPVARAYLEEKNQELLFPLCAQSDKYPFIKASFDGLNAKGEPVEIKCPSQKIFEEIKAQGINSQSYQHYQIQVQHQLLVSDKDIGWLVFYYQDLTNTQEALTFKVMRDEALISQIITQAKLFWKQVQSQKPPDKCPLRDTFIPEDSDKLAWSALAMEYHQLESKAGVISLQLEQVKDEMSSLQKSFLSLMQNFAHAEYDGIRVSRYWSQGQIDYPKLLVDLGLKVEQSTINRYRKIPTEKIRFSVTPHPPSTRNKIGEIADTINESPNLVLTQNNSIDTASGLQSSSFEEAGIDSLLLQPKRKRTKAKSSVDNRKLKIKQEPKEDNHSHTPLDNVHLSRDEALSSAEDEFGKKRNNVLDSALTASYYF
ncbi:YqaJ viral recombinase family nuclease [Thorsellia kenyensis]|uniref:YqaJ viral recombinase family protein n=1 Tax=Thorsellia kenyensis TaxID=1549888 RepID=A0ABV6CA73_9GAMM